MCRDFNEVFSTLVKLIYSSQQPCEVLTIFPYYRWENRFREVKQPALGHTATKWKAWGLNSDTHAQFLCSQHSAGGRGREGSEGDTFLLSLLGPARAQSPLQERVHSCGSPHSPPSFALFTASFYLATWSRDRVQGLDTYVAG